MILHFVEIEILLQLSQREILIFNKLAAFIGENSIFYKDSCKRVYKAFVQYIPRMQNSNSY